MKKMYKILYSIIVMIFSLLATAIGFSLVSDAGLSFLYRFLFDFIFSMQFIATVWVVIALFRKEKK